MLPEAALARVHGVDPWVPIVPGVPVTGLSREGDVVRAFSPWHTQYVLAAAGIDYTDPNRGHVLGLLVVDIPSGKAHELRVVRRRFRFDRPDDIDAAWVEHHFAWQREASGAERLVPREQFRPWPWRARLVQTSPGAWQLDLLRTDAGFVAVLQGLLQAEPGSRLEDVSEPWGRGLVVHYAGCALQARAFGSSSARAEDRRIGIWPASDAVQPGAGPPTRPDPDRCESALRRLAAVIDAELATGRHDGMLRLE